LDAGEDGAILAAAGDSGYRGVWLSGSVFMCAEDQQGKGRGVRLPVIPSPRGWRA
jgi:hypothetical protein